MTLTKCLDCSHAHERRQGRICRLLLLLDQSGASFGVWAFGQCLLSPSRGVPGKCHGLSSEMMRKCNIFHLDLWQALERGAAAKRDKVEAL